MRFCGSIGLVRLGVIYLHDLDHESRFIHGFPAGAAMVYWNVSSASFARTRIWNTCILIRRLLLRISIVPVLNKAVLNLKAIILVVPLVVIQLRYMRWSM